MVRNSVLVVMGKIIVRDLAAEHLGEEHKELRDEFLEDLLNHIEDVNSYVRSKALQIWNEIKMEGAVPLAWHVKILRLVVERLEDRTATVRKNSVTLLKSFLETNPFSPKLSLQELEEQFKVEEAKLDEVRAKIIDQEKLHNEAKAKFNAEYKPQVYPILQELLANEDKSKPAEEIDTENAVERVRVHLNKLEFNNVCELIIQLDACNREKRAAMSIEDQCQYFLFLLSSYLYTDYVSSVRAFLEHPLSFLPLLSPEIRIRREGPAGGLLVGQH